MLSLRCPPDFRQLQAAADRLDDNEASSLAPNRRRDPRRAVGGPLCVGVVPGPCERLTLGRIPVSVFKPTWAGWAVDLSLSGVAMLADRRVAQAERWWLRLDSFATRPTILPAFVAGCRPVELQTDDEAAVAPIFRIRFKFQVSQQSLLERLRLDAPEAVQHDEDDLNLVESCAA